MLARNSLAFSVATNQAQLATHNSRYSVGYMAVYPRASFVWREPFQI